MSNRSTINTSWPAALLVASLGITGAACSGQGPNAMTGPSSIGGAQAKPGDVTATEAGTTVVTFPAYDPATMILTVQTQTSSSLGQPYIDHGKIHLQMLVSAAGDPVPCGTVGADWVRFDGDGGGLDVTGAMTSHNVDLDDLSSLDTDPNINNASCGQSVCIRAQYVTGGGNPKVDTHFSEPVQFDIPCPSCTYTQGYWKTHGPVPTGNNENEWPVTSLTLGTVNYTDLQLQSILDAPVAGNGLISLAHQLIAAKLNIANGTPDGAVAAAIAAADALIGALVIPPVGSGYLDPADTSALTGTLASYNEGIIGPGHCGS